MENRPQLPQKLPAEARKKRSVVNIADIETLTNVCANSIINNYDDENEYSNYLTPIEPPASHLKSISSPKKNEDFEFFNESIYFNSNSNTTSNNDDDAYSSLASYTSPEPAPTKPAARKSLLNKSRISEQQQQQQQMETSPCLIEMKNNDSSPRPAIPPKRKLSEQFGKLTLMPSQPVVELHQDKKQTKSTQDDDDANMYILPSDKKVLSFGKSYFYYYRKIMTFSLFYSFKICFFLRNRI